MDSKDNNNRSSNDKIVELQIAHKSNKTRFDELYNQLEQEYTPLLAKVTYYYRWAGDRDDLWQTARMIFFDGLLAFRCNGPVYFGCYIKSKVYGDMRTYARRVKRYNKHEKLASNDEQGRSWIETRLISEGAIDTEMQWQSLLESLQLSDRDHKILDLIYVKQYRFAEIARLWSVDPSTIRKAHKRVIENFQQQTLLKSLY